MKLEDRYIIESQEALIKGAFTSDELRFIADEIERGPLKIDQTSHKGEKDTLVKIAGQFIQCDHPTKSGRIYTKKSIDQIINLFNYHKQSGPFFGEYGVSDKGEINIHNISHEVEEIHFNEEENTLDGTILVLDTSAGRHLIDMVKGDLLDQIVVRPRGYGNINDAGEIEDFQIISFDIIPSSQDPFGESKEDINKFPFFREPNLNSEAL